MVGYGVDPAAGVPVLFFCCQKHGGRNKNCTQFSFAANCALLGIGLRKGFWVYALVKKVTHSVKIKSLKFTMGLCI